MNSRILRSQTLGGKAVCARATATSPLQSKQSVGLHQLLMDQASLQQQTPAAVLDTTLITKGGWPTSRLHGTRTTLHLMGSPGTGHTRDLALTNRGGQADALITGCHDNRAPHVPRIHCSCRLPTYICEYNKTNGFSTSISSDNRGSITTD
ncbi:hypothetical protein BGW80DRAFT_525651 [Lactifluus volemus]|nr:hypothetical protein BGW80DRAFT_525651 [Lactifluus volemus]